MQVFYCLFIQQIPVFNRDAHLGMGEIPLCFTTFLGDM